MSEITELKEMVLDQSKQIERMLKLLEVAFTRHKLPDSEWVDEAEAAQLCSLTPDWFRRMCKSIDHEHRLPINYRHRNNRKYQYYLPDIERYLKSIDTLPKKKTA